MFVLCPAVCEFIGETIRNMFGVVVILLSNVMDVFSVGRDAMLDRPCMVL